MNGKVNLKIVYFPVKLKGTSQSHLQVSGVFYDKTLDLTLSLVFSLNSCQILIIVILKRSSVKFLIKYPVSKSYSLYNWQRKHSFYFIRIFFFIFSPWDIQIYSISIKGIIYPIKSLFTFTSNHLLVQLVQSDFISSNKPANTST